MKKFLELLKKALSENKDASKIDVAVLETALKTAFDESEKGLRENRDEVLGEKKAAVKELKELKDKFKDVDPEEYAKLAEEEEARKIRKANGGKDDDDDDSAEVRKELTDLKIEVAKNNKINERVTKEKDDALEAATTQGETYKTLLFTSEKGSSLSKAFDSFNIKAEHRSVLRDAFRSKTKVEIDDEGKIVVSIVGDDDIPLPVEDFFKSWSVTDAAKPYIGAKVNKGGGAHGGNGEGEDDEVVPTEKIYEDQFGNAGKAAS